MNPNINILLTTIIYKDLAFNNLKYSKNLIDQPTMVNSSSVTS